MGVWPPLRAFLTQTKMFVDENGKPLSYSTIIKDVYTAWDELTRQEEFKQFRRKGSWKPIRK